LGLMIDHFSARQVLLSTYLVPEDKLTVVSILTCWLSALKWCQFHDISGLV